MRAGMRRADRVVTGVVLAAMLAWSLLQVVLGWFLLRPVSTCAGPEYRCTAVTDAGIALGAVGPLIVAVATLAAVVAVGMRGRTTWLIAVAGALLVVLVQLVAPLLIAAGIVPA